MRLSSDPEGKRLPIKLDSTSNGEFMPIPLNATNRRAGIVTLTKNKPNLLLDHEAKPLKMSISTIGESPRFRCESD